MENVGYRLDTNLTQSVRLFPTLNGHDSVGIGVIVIDHFVVRHEHF
jgi:hypothetical protein